MFDQIEDAVINTLVQKLNTHGINISAETLKKAVANSPQIVTQIEGILLASSSEERLNKITALIRDAAQEGSTTGSREKFTETENK